MRAVVQRVLRARVVAGSRTAGEISSGVLVLLDNRITRQRYGQVFFDSLPDYGFTTRLNDVENFFACLK